MTTAVTNLIGEFNNWLGNALSNPGDWYVGIASNARKRLFEDHQLDSRIDGPDKWKYKDAGTRSNADVFERYYLNRGVDGGTRGGGNTTIWVYICRKSERFKR